MLRIVIPLSEGFDEEAGEFVDLQTYQLDLEHSLVSLSKWESKWEKPFLGNEAKTEDQTLDYIRMMVLGEQPDEKVFSCLTSDNIKAIDTYINAKMTATTFNERQKQQQSREIITAELIYYWMVSLSIPVEFQDWHLNRLLTLIRVCNIKNTPKEKLAKTDTVRQRRELNAERRKQTGSRG